MISLKSLHLVGLLLFGIANYKQRLQSTIWYYSFDLNGVKENSSIRSIFIQKFKILRRIWTGPGNLIIFDLLYCFFDFRFTTIYNWNSTKYEGLTPSLISFHIVAFSYLVIKIIHLLKPLPYSFIKSSESGGYIVVK